jgi:hypothetical protein
MYTEEDRYAAWLILQEANQGRPVEFIAQNIASLISVGGGDPMEELTAMMAKILNRVAELLRDDGAEIWQHLQPGGHQGDYLPYKAIKMLS